VYAVSASCITRHQRHQTIDKAVELQAKERRQILDEFARVTGYHRKHALRVINCGKRLSSRWEAGRPTLHGACCKFDAPWPVGA
jgi:hypothetical protein